MPLTYLAVGHISKDVLPDGDRLGGTVAFCARVAHALGSKVYMLTSAPAATQLLAPLASIITIHRIAAQAPTSFKNVYTAEGRRQTLLSRAEDLKPRHIQPDWPPPSILHIAPIANEIDPVFFARRPSTLTLLTPQGFLRQWDADGTVHFSAWQQADRCLPLVDAVIFSREDVNDDMTLARSMANAAPIGIITLAEEGLLLIMNGVERHIAAPPVEHVEDPTGAGDILAAAFAIHLRQTSDPLRAAQFAVHLASDSVTRPLEDAIPPQAVIKTLRNQF